MNEFAMENRLLWKEFRALRLVWLMCALGVTLVMTLFTVFAETQGAVPSYSVGLWGFAVWVPPVYVLVALATMFAGEREEGTLVWLSVLAPPSGRLLATRLLYVITTGIALQVWLSAAASLLSQFDQHPVSNLALDSLFTMSFLLVEAVVWGTFWSLQTSRPMHAVCLSSATLVLVNWSGLAIADVLRSSVGSDFWKHAFSTWGWGRCLLAAGGIAASGPMTRHWLAGRPWDWGFLSHWWARRKGQSTSNPVAEPAEAWQRTWRRLLWLEWQTLRSFGWIVGGLMVVAWIGVAAATPIVSVTTCWLTALIGGALAWHGEQAQQRFRCLTNTGASSSGLWFNKLLLWLPVTMLGVAVIAVPAFTAWQIFSHVDSSYWRQDPDSAFLLLKLLPGLKFSLALLSCYALTTFCVAFLSSHALQSSILAFATAVLSSLVLGIWFLVLAGDYLPLVWFAAPIPLWLLWASWRRLPDWWVGRTGFRVTSARMLELTVFPLLLLPLATGHRVWEVPFVPLPEVYSADHPADPVATAQNVAGWQRVVTIVNGMTEPPDGRLVVVSLNAESTALREAPIPETDETIRQHRRLERLAWIETNRALLDELRSQLSKLSALVPEAAIWRQVEKSRGRWSAVVVALAELAVQELDQDQPEESIEWLQASFRLYGARRAGAPLTRGFEIVRGRLVWRAAVERWAQHPHQTRDTLSRGLQQAADSWRFTVSDVTNVLAEREYFSEWNQQFWPWEEARRQRLLNIAASNQWIYLCEVRQGNWLPSADLDEEIGRGRRYRTWNVRGRTTDDWRSSPSSSSVVGLDSSSTLFMQINDCDLRATIVDMALAGYRQLYGDLPGSLYDLNPLLGSAANMLIDPWTGAPFGYEPKGFPLSAPEFSPEHILRQPLIWSGGPWHYRIQILDNTLIASSDISGRRAMTIKRAGTPGDFEVNHVWVLPQRVETESE